MARLPYFRFLSSVFFATSFVYGSPHHGDQTERKLQSMSQVAAYSPTHVHGHWALHQEKGGEGGGGGRREGRGREQEGDEEPVRNVVEIRGRRLRGFLENGGSRDKRAVYGTGGGFHGERTFLSFGLGEGVGDIGGGRRGVRVERDWKLGGHQAESPRRSLGDAVEVLTQKVVRLTDRLVGLEEGLDSRLAALEEGLESRISESVRLEDTLVTALTSRLAQVDALVRKVDSLDARLSTETAELRTTVTHTNRDVQSAVRKLAHLEGLWRERGTPTHPEERDATGGASAAQEATRSADQGGAGLQQNVVKGVEAALDSRHHTLLWNLRKVISNEFVVLRGDFDALRKENGEFKEEIQQSVAEFLETQKAPKDSRVTEGAKGEEGEGGKEEEQEEEEEEEEAGERESESPSCAQLEAMLTEVHRNWSDAFRRVSSTGHAGGELFPSLPRGQGTVLHVIDQKTFRQLVNQSLQRLVSGSDVDSLLHRLQQWSPVKLKEETVHPKGAARVPPPEEAGGGGTAGMRLAKANESSEEVKGPGVFLSLIHGRHLFPLSGPLCPTVLLDPSTMTVLNEIKTLLRSLLTKNEVLYQKLQEVAREELNVLSNIQKRVSVLVRRMGSEPSKEVACDVAVQLRALESVVRDSYSSLVLAQEAFLLNCKRIQDQEPSLEEQIAELLQGLLSNIEMGHEFSRRQLEELRRLLVHVATLGLEGQPHAALANAAEDAFTRLKGVIHKIDFVKKRILTRDWIPTGQKEYADDLLTAAKDLEGLAQEQLEALLTVQSTFVEMDDNSTLLTNLEGKVDVEALIGRLQDVLSKTDVVRQIMADQGKRITSYPITSRQLAFSCHEAVLESLRSLPKNSSSSFQPTSSSKQAPKASGFSADASKNVEEGDDDDEIYDDDEEDVPAWYYDPDILSGNFGTPDHEFPPLDSGWVDQYTDEDEEEEEEEEEEEVGEENEREEEEEDIAEEESDIKEEKGNEKEVKKAQGLGVSE